MTRSKERALELYLVGRARAGDRRSMAGLVKLRGPRLMAHAVRLIAEQDAARDIVQDAWAEILRGLPKLRDDSAFLPWSLRIVSRRVAREIAGRQRNRKIQAEYSVEAEDSISGQAEANLTAADVRRAIATLGPEHRATIALFYLEDMNVAEVAAALDVPVGTVKTRLMHARAKLKRELEGDET